VHLHVPIHALNVQRQQSASKLDDIQTLIKMENTQVGRFEQMLPLNIEGMLSARADAPPAELTEGRAGEAGRRGGA